jgi:hypothetical protein
VLSTTARKKIIDATWNLEKFEDTTEYMQLLQAETH